MAGAPSWDETTPIASGPPSWDDTTPIDDHGLAERQKLSPVGKALSPITSYPATYGQMNREAREQMSQGVGQMLHPTESLNPFTHPEARGLSQVLTGVGNVAAGGLNYLSSPINAAYRSIAGQPIEDVTGIPREYTEFAAQLATPYLGLKGAPREVPGAPSITPRSAPADFVPPARDVVPDVPRQTPRPEAGVDLLPPDTPHTLPPERRSLSAMGSSGPLSDISDDTIAHMRNVMEEQGFTPHTIDQRLGEMSEHHMFGEITPSLEADMGAVAAPPGPAKLEVIGSLRQRAVEARERVQNIFNRAFGVNENMAQLRRTMDIDRQRAATPFYERFRNTVITPTPEIDALMPRLRASGALQSANRSLELEGEPLSHGFIDFAGEPPEVTQVPTASAFQYAKEALDDKIGAAVRAGERNEARRLVGLQKDLLSALDNHPQVGDIWRQARTTYAQPTEIMKAADFGKQVLTGKIDPEELPFLTAGYSEPQMAAMRMGMRSYLENMLGKRDALTAETINAALSPNNIQKMRWAIGDEATDQLVNAMEAERHMHTAPTRIHGGSPTAFRLEAQKRWVPEPPGRGVTVHDVTGAIHRPGRTVAGKAFEAAAEKFGAAKRAKEEARMARLREEASHIFTLQGPERDAVARYLVGGQDVGAVPPPLPTRAQGGRTNFHRARHAHMIKKQGGGELSDDDQAAMMPETFNPIPDWTRQAAQKDVGTLRNVGAGIGNVATSLATLPQRAIDASTQDVQHLGEEGYEPQLTGPALEAAMLPMGTGAIAGVPVRAGEQVLGAGAVKATKAPQIKAEEALKAFKKATGYEHGESPTDVPLLGRGDVQLPPGMNLKKFSTEVDKKAQDVKEWNNPQRRYWYENSGQAINEATGRDPEMADRVTFGVAKTSQGTPVLDNAAYTIRAHNQLMAGDPIATGKYPNTMSPQIAEAYRTQEAGAVGPKIGGYQSGFRSIWSPQLNAGANDIHNMRWLGWKDFADTPTTGQHNYDRLLRSAVTDRLNKEGYDGGNWMPGQVQAVGWAKARAEGGVPADEAGYDITDAFRDRAARLTYESAPGKTTDHMPEYHDAPLEVKQAYHDAINNVLQDEHGRDLIAAHMGLLTMPSEHGVGVYQGAASPGTHARVLTGSAPGGWKNGIDASSRQLMEASELARGTLLQQDAVAFHFPFFPKSGMNWDTRNLFDVQTGRPMGVQEAKNVSDALAKETGSDFFSPIFTRNGYRFINVPEASGVSNKQLQAALNKVLPRDARVEMGYNDGFYHFNDWSQGGADGYLQRLKTLKPDVQRRASELFATLGPRISAIEERFAKEHGWTPNRANRIWETNPAYKGTSEGQVTAGQPPKPWESDFGQKPFRPELIARARGGRVPVTPTYRWPVKRAPPPLRDWYG